MPHVENPDTRGEDAAKVKSTKLSTTGTVEDNKKQNADGPNSMKGKTEVRGLIYFFMPVKIKGLIFS